jgi:hypothetical protein
VNKFSIFTPFINQTVAFSNKLNKLIGVDNESNKISLESTGFN